MKKTILFSVMFLTAAGMILPACSSTSPDSAQALTENSWKLISYGPLASLTTTLADAQGRLTFRDDGSLTGNFGCNNFNGSYEVQGESISIGVTSITGMACDGPAMEQENALMSVFYLSENFKIEDKVLTIYYDGGSSAFTLTAEG